jgi:hypothetical protein
MRGKCLNRLKVWTQRCHFLLKAGPNSLFFAPQPTKQEAKPIGAVIDSAWDSSAAAEQG